jgi:2-polyprenyl-3-methyl-5-hydroxy-6-metoxy-1,4-benzoquinol methylase
MTYLEHINCPLCKFDRTKFLFKRNDCLHQTNQDYFNVVQCKQCNTVYLNPRPTEDEIHNFYPEEFYDTTHTPERTILEKAKGLIGKHELVRRLKPGAVLDVGCSKGEFLYMMKTMGWDVTGFDFSSKPPNVFNLDIRYGELSKTNLPKESFDLITLWGVLEHVYYPSEMLAEVNKLLKPGGNLILTVTNFNSLQSRVMRQDDIPRHTTLFTKTTLSAMLENNGFFNHKFIFDQSVFGGSVRGLLNYVVKILAGESIDSVVIQNRTPGKWNEFATQLNGKPSKLVESIDRVDEKISPFVDKILEALEFGFIMTSISTKLSSILDYDKSQLIPMPVPFNKLNGNMWGVELKSYETIADNNSEPRRSPLILLENETPIWKNHSLHDDISKLGRGRYSHWESYLYFSTTDNSNPNTNGKKYHIALSNENRSN